MSSFRLISLFIVGALNSNIVQAIEPQQSDYRSTGQVAGKDIKILPGLLKDAALSRTASKEKDKLQSIIENAVNGHLGFGFLEKVVVDKHPVADHKTIRSIQKEQLSTDPMDKFVRNEDSSGLVQFKKFDGKIQKYNVLLSSQLEKQVVGEVKHESEVIRKAEAARRAKSMESARLEIEQQQQSEAQPRRLLEQARRIVVDQAEMARLRQAELPRPVVARPLPTLPFDATGRPGFADGF